MGRLLLVLAIVATIAACARDVPPQRATPPAARVVPAAPRQDSALVEQLLAAAPTANPVALRLALQARECALSHGDITAGTRLAVIDYSRPSTERRLWVFDLRQPRLLYDEYVAHGRGSGENRASRFSNDEGSLESSLGLFRTAETYDGGNGYSLRMDGLEPGFNDHARERMLVMHGAWYVDPVLARTQGRLGRSYGCPALRTQVAHAVIDTLKQGQLLFAYYPDREWLARSRFLACDAPRAAEPIASLHAVPR